MVGIAIFACVTAEMVQRRERLARCCIAHHERADAYLDRVGRVCKLGQTPASIEAFYRRQGPLAWRDYQAALHHLALANEFSEAANRTWLPGLVGFPPLDGFRDVGSIVEWGLEAMMEAMLFLGIFAVLLTIRAGTAGTTMDGAGYLTG
jgi:hypothetical protein